jgi:hypothetical protein
MVCISNMAHNYQTVREGLLPWQTARIRSRINGSTQFELRKAYHVYIKRTNTRVGFLGYGTAELVDTNKPETRPYKKDLRILFNAV